MQPILVNTEARAVVVDPERRALLSASCADKCCGGGPCPNYVKVRWCCDPTREAWTFLNRPDCPGYIEWLASLSTTESQVFRIADDPTQTCWATDPVPEGNIRPYAEIPPNALILARGQESQIMTGCSDTRCAPCPECCGSRLQPLGCGDVDPNNQARCCECGDGYTLTITETANSSAIGTHYADPCSVYPSLGSQPSWESSATHTATFQFKCREVDDGNGGTRLERYVVGTSTVERTRTIHYANIVYRVPRDNFDPIPCGLVSFGQGRTDTDTQVLERSWDDIYSGEGCGLVRSFVARLAPENLIPGILAGMGNGIARFDIAGECFGTESVSLPPCDSPDAFACRMGIPFIGYDLRWSGTRNCDGGEFTESGTFGGAHSNWAEVTVLQGSNVSGPSDMLWPGGQSGQWSYSIRWSVSGGEACDADPCGQQQPNTRSKETVRRSDTRPHQGDPLTREQILSIALRSGGKRCNCGKR